MGKDFNSIRRGEIIILAKVFLNIMKTSFQVKLKHKMTEINPGPDKRRRWKKKNSNKNRL